MQNTTGGVAAEVAYRERLSPSLWVLVSAAVVAPMAALVFTPIDTTVALVIGALAGVAFVALLVAGSPRVEVRDGELRAGRAHIDVRLLGEPVVRTGEEARLARGPQLDPRAWHVIRGGIDGVVMAAVQDPDDPTPVWVVSSRTPDRLAAALRRAQSGRPGAVSDGA
ncbi:DUF3093 domain-containing protein [Microbacterium sp. RU33B]|uniref:DUF3093 domain-containing protein n=1 Tax=Microbacterium sp. RU33B TaxID=1907390 RepID=UPI000967B7BC|nr:DUF3093 domain-containing protein [Microbacterium sp. RU33B]SIT74726.1 Protein of unknown function [Microbacterium sp. RU33B]